MTRKKILPLIFISPIVFLLGMMGRAEAKTPEKEWELIFRWEGDDKIINSNTVREIHIGNTVIKIEVKTNEI